MESEKKLIIAEIIAEYVDLLTNNPEKDEEKNKVICSRMMVLRNELILLVDSALWKLLVELAASKKQSDVWDILLKIRASLAIAEGEICTDDAMYHSPGIGRKDENTT